jgi:hypothetical protein
MRRAGEDYEEGSWERGGRGQWPRLCSELRAVRARSQTREMVRHPVGGA